MDPIANLREQLALAAKIQMLSEAEANGGQDVELARLRMVAAASERLADLVLALNDWISKGGFSPWGAAH
jgi:hypothetical protein